MAEAMKSDDFYYSMLTCSLSPKGDFLKDVGLMYHC